MVDINRTKIISTKFILSARMCETQKKKKEASPIDRAPGASPKEQKNTFRKGTMPVHK